MAKIMQRKKEVLKKEGKKRNILKTVVKTPYDIILCGLKTPKATLLMESENTLVFYCKREANKFEIKEAFKAIYNTDPAKVNTLITRTGHKKAYVKCRNDGEAFTIASEAEIL